MTRPIACRWVLLALALALLSACAHDSGEWVRWAGKDIHIPAGYELGETGFGKQRHLEEGQHTEGGTLFVWAEIVEATTGDIVGLLICEQFSCELSPWTTWRRSLRIRPSDAPDRRERPWAIR